MSETKDMKRISELEWEVLKRDARIADLESALMVLWSIQTEEMGRRIIRDFHPEAHSTVDSVLGER